MAAKSKIKEIEISNSQQVVNFGKLATSKKVQDEPKALKEIHDIRGYLSKLSKEEIENRLEDIRHRYKHLIVS